jgi:putative oxidoreductase
VINEEGNMAQTRNRVVSALAVLLGVVMIGGGAVKLAGVQSQVVAFTAWGLPGWFRALVGTFEILGGLLLIVPATIPAGSVILSTIMVGAVWAHIANGEWPHVVPVAILLTLFLTIFRFNRAQALRLLGSA